LVCYYFFLFSTCTNICCCVVFSYVTSQISAYRSGHAHSLYPFNVLDPLWRPNRIFWRMHISCTIGWLGADFLDTKALKAPGVREGGLAVTRLTSWRQIEDRFWEFVLGKIETVHVWHNVRPILVQYHHHRHETNGGRSRVKSCPRCQQAL
jgi:hypothetical protein